MPYIKLEDFSGTVPRTGPTQLEANQAQTANNVKLQSKELRSWADPVLAYNPVGQIQTIYRINSTNGDKYWLQWNAEVDMVPGPVADVSEFRYYYTGDGLPKKTNSALATTNNTGVKPFPNSWLYMGVPAPTAAPTLVGSQPVKRVTITDGGSGYTSAPAVSFSSGSGSGATATATINAKIDTITVTAGGSGYTSAPTVSFSGGSGSGATATAVVTAGEVTSIVINNVGAGYTSAPTITISGGGGTGATATATIAGSISSISLSSGGSGYATAPVVSFSGGGGSGAIAEASFEPVETRAYVYTNVSTFGSVKEESAPSPATLITVANTGATVTVSGFSSAPTSGYNITHRRIYRTITGANTVTYSFVAEIPVGTSSYADSKTVTQLGSQLPSLYWNEPPTDLKGLVAMPNGILAGFKGNQVWFSEPYYPHAWPEGYMLTVDDPIVGLGVFQTTLVVLTTRFPVLISGVSPTSMSQQKLPIPQPCVSKKSIASDQYGVLYASPNGLVSIGAGTQDVVTLPLYTRDEWQALNPDTMKGLIYNNMYMGFYTASGGSKAIVISRGDIPPLVNLDYNATGTFVDRETADIYAISGLDGKVYQLDSSDINFTTFEWLSKKFVMPNPCNFGAVKVQANFPFMNSIAGYNELVAAIRAANQALFAANAGKVQGAVNDNPINHFTLNGSLLQDIPQEANFRYINLLVYADGQLIFTTGIKNQEPIRMPADQKGYVYEIRISGNTPVRSVIMASSIGELRNVAP